MPREILRHLNLRGQRAAVIHPPRHDRGELIAQLSEIGFINEVIWPPAAPSLPVRFAFLALGIDAPFYTETVRIAVMEHESPAELAKLLDGGYDGVIVKPVRADGLVSLLLHASHGHEERMAMERRLKAHEQKLQSFRTVEKAKEFLMRERAISGDEAFAQIRRMAMDRRTTVEEIAAEITEAEKLLKKLSLK